jgi:hypothetical protein
MTKQAMQAITDEIARAKALLKARDGKPGYSVNVQSIRARIAELEAMTPDDG